MMCHENTITATFALEMCAFISNFSNNKFVVDRQDMYI